MPLGSQWGQATEEEFGVSETLLLQGWQAAVTARLGFLSVLLAREGSGVLLELI